MAKHERRFARRGLILAPLGLAVAARARGAAAQQSPAPVTIGFVLPYTGDLAWFGQEIGRGYELAVKKINAGDARERPIGVIKADVPSPTAALGELGRLRDQGVRVVWSWSWS